MIEIPGEELQTSAESARVYHGKQSHGATYIVAGLSNIGERGRGHCERLSGSFWGGEELCGEAGSEDRLDEGSEREDV